MGRTTTLTISSPCRHLGCVSMRELYLPDPASPVPVGHKRLPGLCYRPEVSRPVKGQRSNAPVSADVRVSVTALFCHGRMKEATDNM